jgi:hypothetical protein
MRTTRTIVGALALATLVLSLPATGALAQPTLPVENHYKCYNLRNVAGNLLQNIQLDDQFGSVTVSNLVFERYATPAEKIHNGVPYPMVDPLIHMDWWRVNTTMPLRYVNVTDQFGTAKWTLAHARYLLVPSLKNPPVPGPPVPTWNHYLCYDVVPPALLINQPVTLIDQFGNVQAQVFTAKFLCNPVKKTVFTPTGPVVYPIIDETAHLACYHVSGSGSPPPLPITAYDQFGLWQDVRLDRYDCMCVPARKEETVPTKPSTWGKIKSLYRS